MDHSNPVADASRKKVKDIISDVKTRRKQDLEYLATVVSGARRIYLPSLPKRDVGDEVLEAELSRLVKALPPVDPSPLTSSDLEFLDPQGAWPVSGLLDRDEPLHPPGVHQVKGNVTTTRTFGGSQIDQEFARRMLEYRALSDFQHSVKSVFTRGTASGFIERLSKLTSRKLPPVTKSLGVNKTTVRKTLRRLLPVDLSVLERMSVNWHSDLVEQLDEIETSSISSAGPPYWVKKPFALAKMVNVVLPLLHEAISQGKVTELFKQQPELFLGEVKNKLDRYDREKLKSKTRPYFGMPFHLQALFSMMSQPFTHALELFHEGVGSNAYGHSWAHGGVEKLRRWAMETKDLKKRGRPRFCAYGDDVDIYVRRDGVLWRLAPDFQQMDGSVDACLIETVVDYVVETLSAAWGENPFFESVADLWKMYATDPCFLVNGSEVYRKKQKDGLMTGVVGTTLFDTAKSVLAYDAWADEVAAGNIKLLEYQAAANFFQSKFGLVVKDGTWDLQRVREDPVPGELWAPSRFLGVYFIYNQGPQEAQLVPYLNDEEWVDLLMTPRDDPANFKRGRPKDSQVMISRRWFDRARGYTITGAFSNPLTQKWINGFVNGLDPVSIVMSVQAGGGKGAPPEASCQVREDFEYPDSSGFPSVRWCENLYFTEENQWPEAEWIQILPDVAGALEDFRKKHKALKPEMYVLEMSNKHPEKSPPFMAQQMVEYVLETELFEPEMEEVKPMDPISGPKEVRVLEKPNPRSKIVSLDPGGENPKERKRMPTAAEAIWRLFETRAVPVPMPRVKDRGAVPSPLWREMATAIEEGRLDTKVWRTPVMSLRDLARATGRTLESTSEIARTSGLYVLGKEEKVVTKVPLITADPKVGGQLLKQEKENREHSRVIAPTTTLIMKSLKHVTKASPMEFEMVENPKFRPHFGMTASWVPNRNPMVSLNSLVQVNGYIPKVLSRNVSVEGGQKTETQLLLMSQRLSTPFQWYLKRVGAGTKDNILKMYQYILKSHGLTEAEVRQIQEYRVKMDTPPPVAKSWSDQVSEEERAQIRDESGLLFRVTGKHLEPLDQHGDWMEIRGNKTVLGGVLWKQRKGETLMSFLRRTVKRLEEFGLKPTFQTRPPTFTPIKATE